MMCPAWSVMRFATAWSQRDYHRVPRSQPHRADFRPAIRLLRRHPLLGLLNILSVALGEEVAIDLTKRSRLLSPARIHERAAPRQFLTDGRTGKRPNVSIRAEIYPVIIIPIWSAKRGLEGSDKGFSRARRFVIRVVERFLIGCHDNRSDVN